MQAERWRRVQEVFEGALERPPEERPAFLDEACAEDRELRVEVEAMLAADEAETGFIESAVGEAAQALIDPITASGRFGKYEILGKIGQGGFGQVHEGRDPLLRRSVAIKTCTSDDPQLRQRFFREAHISARLQHPNVTTVHDFGFEKGIPFLVQELLSGEDLQQKIARRDPLDLAERVAVLLEVARGLAYAHQEGVLHRDVKPSNVRVLDSGQIKILDFGIARVLDDSTGLTDTGLALGTVGYLAPEQLEGGEVDRRSDVFSFGVLAYELLSYERPFAAETVSQASYRLLTQEPRPLGELCPGCPPELARIVARCMRKKPRDRYQSFEPLIADLEAVAERLETDGDEATRVLPARPPRRRGAGRWVTGAAAAAFLALAALWLRSDDPPPAARAPLAELAAPSPPVDVPPEPVAEPPADAAVAAVVEPAPDDEAEREPPEVVAESAASETPPPPEAPPPPPEPVRVEPRPAANVDTGRAAAIEPAETRPPASARRDPPPPPLPAAAPEETSAASGRPDPSPPEPPAREPAAAPPETRAPPPSSAGLITPGPGVVEPVLLDRPQPAYPERAQRRKKEAQVIVAVLVGEQGNVQRALVKQTTARGFGFEDAAVAAARGARFRPATRDGVAGRMWTEIAFDFRLD